ncbi:sigma factor G inhibitor Gin [Desulforamulus ruminis]|uniref:Sigma-G inhibitor, Gin n=1 Tax=Desulforamulus ruminis (strain ATCC 23193 / DSM 2154 / NCIMB 8452 / DL) TaxID=696281 RepID=F6DLW6_DESRL|nr:sigma factor G inhibitor Gin [Desulforamulus ruminis]AEG58409.1 Sigma-G inhibitor, Gin [Desulforamulus ruminis DSM 2154]
MEKFLNCALCRKSVPENNTGITLLGSYICEACENKIANLAWDDPEYDLYKSGLKKIWRCNEA